MEPQTRTAFGPPIKHSRRRGPSRGTTLRSARRSRGANGPMIGHSPSLSRACSRAGWPHDWQTCHPLPSCPLRPHGDGTCEGISLAFAKPRRSQGAPVPGCLSCASRAVDKPIWISARRQPRGSASKRSRCSVCCAVDRRRVDHRPHGGSVPELLGDQTPWVQSPLRKRQRLQRL